MRVHYTANHTIVRLMKPRLSSIAVLACFTATPRCMHPLRTAIFMCVEILPCDLILVGYARKKQMCVGPHARPAHVRKMKWYQWNPTHALLPYVGLYARTPVCISLTIELHMDYRMSNGCGNCGSVESMWECVRRKQDHTTWNAWAVDTFVRRASSVNKCSCDRIGHVRIDDYAQTHVGAQATFILSVPRQCWTTLSYNVVC
jgi:hypothetical protein